MQSVIRDGSGLRPHYYWKKNPSVHGWSVLELLAAGVPRKLSREGFWSYMLCGAVQEPFTLIEDAYSLPPGCQLSDVVPGSAAYSNIQTFKHSNNSHWTREAAQEIVTAAVEASVRETLERNGGTPCAFLSGGIDSGALVAVMRNVLGKDAEIRTCCVIREDPRTGVTRDTTDGTELALFNRENQAGQFVELFNSIVANNGMCADGV